MKKITLTWGLSVLIFTAFGQEYFQQSVNYNIQVRLDDQAKFLRGFEEVLYANNSPDTLRYIYFHLWPNAYKNKQTAMAKQLLRLGKTEMYFASEDELGYIDSLDFKLDGLPCKWELDAEHIDICKIYLNNPLPPGLEVIISTPFLVKIPSGKISRLGHVGQSFQITQWYPKPAVYDTAGWHQMPYLTQGEFYSEFGSYDVDIELPSNYVVGATGNLATTEEVKWMEGKAKETRQWIDEIESNSDWSEAARDDSFPASSKDLKKLHFYQNDVHDFAWFADKRYRVLKGKVALPQSGDSVTVWTMFTNGNARLWQHSIKYMHDAVYYYSLWNGDYPYKQATAVDGTISAGGGMEYPNVTVIGDAGDDLSLETVIMHEVGHNWFYGILGSNEREFPWLDEGINSYNEQRYLSTKYPDGTVLAKDGPNRLLRFAGLDKYGIEDQHELTYLLLARANRDQPMNLSAEEYSFLNYGFVVYSKSAITLNYLRHYLGDSLMDAGMHRYFNENKFMHPGPKDFENAIETTANQDLDWFFNDVVTTRGKVDYGIKSVKIKEGETSVKLKNRGLKVPVHVSLLENGTIKESRWVSGFEKDTTLKFQGIGDRVEIDHDRIMPELIRDNNYSNTKGVFKRIEPIKFKFLGSVEHPWKNYIFYTPILGMNVPNGFMPGVLLYNHLVPSRKFTYALAPMIGTKSKSIVGTGRLSYSINPVNSVFENVELSLGGKRYAYGRVQGNELFYNRVSPKVTFYLRPRDYAGFIDQNFSIGSVVNLNQSQTVNSTSEWVDTLTAEYFNRVQYEFNYRHPVYDTKSTISLEEHKEYVRTSLEVRETISWNKKVRISGRYFAGAFLSNNTTNPKYNWRMDGQSASTDYAFDGELFDRSGSDDFLSRQFMANHGGFKVPTPVGQSSRWLMALNVKAKASKFPVGVFADGGLSQGGNFIWDAGVYAAIVPDFIEVYLPLVYEKSIDTAIKANGLKWHDLIRFQIALHKLDIIETVKRLELP